MPGPAATPDRARRLPVFLVAMLAATLLAWGWSQRELILDPVDRALTAEDVTIDFWYGSHQRFGTPGRPQPWINLLGNVQPAGQIDSLSFSVKGGAERPLNVGGDLHRLAMAGDFNAEIGWDEMGAGLHDVTVRARMRNGVLAERTLTIELAEEAGWPLPYEVDFGSVDDLQSVVQVVDGEWRLHPDGVRTVQRYYDRVLTLGDTNWTDYEALVHLTVHDFTPPKPSPPTYDVTHFGVAMRWRGHHDDGRQPRRKWFPLGAQGELLVRTHPDSSRWRVLRDQPSDKPPLFQRGHERVELGAPLWLRTQVATVPDGRTRYRFKHWADGDTEPADWDVQVFERDDYPSGALCLVPHNTDVTIHRVRVTPLAPGEVVDGSAPDGVPRDPGG